MSIWSNPLLFGIPGGGGSGVDTGLGWSAKGDWLMNQTGEIGYIESSGTSPTNLNPSYEFSNANQPIPPTYSTVYFYESGPFGGQLRGDSNVYVCVYKANNILYFLMLSTEPGKVYYYRAQGTSDDWGPSRLSNYSDGVYYSSGRPGGGILANQSFYVPYYNSLEDALNAFRVFAGIIVNTASYSKSTVGYAVTCMCKWKTSVSGNIYCSPVLISSVESNTAYTRDSTAVTSPSQYSFNDITFYMRKGTSDVTSGTLTITSEVPLLDLSSAAIYTDDALFYTVLANAGVYANT